MPLRDMDREQMWLLPPSLDELVPLDHPARFLAEFVDALDREGWSELGVEIEGDPLGAPAYHPRALLSVWLYGFMTGVRSCRKLEAACRDQIPYLWLTGWQHPDHNTLWRFYKGHRQAMRKLFERTVRTAVQAVDTKVGANASVYRTHDAEELRQLLNRVEAAIRDLEAQNEAGEDTATAHLLGELANKEMLRKQVRQAMADLESKGRQKRINLTDGDARLMKTRGSVLLGYNAQAMVSPLEPDGGATGMFITAVDMADDSRDEKQLVPMIEQAEETTGTKSEMTLADAAYHSGKGLEECTRRGQSVAIPETRQQLLGDSYHKDRFIYDQPSDSFMCPQGQRLEFLRIQRTNGVPWRLYRASGGVCQACPAFGVCTRSKEFGRSLAIGPYDAALRRHRARMSTNEAREAYKRRKPLVEPVFGIIKEQLAARRFLLRGMVNVLAEWTLLATAFNLRTLWRVWCLCVFVNLLRGPKHHFAS